MTMQATIRAAGLLMAMVAGQAGAAAPLAALPGPPFPNFSSAADVQTACDKGLAGARSRVARLERHPPDTRWIAAMDDLAAYIEDVSGAIFVLTTVHPDKAIRDATEACELRWQDYSSTFNQNEKLYRAARRVRPRDEVEREFMKSTLESFEDAGVSLPPAQRRQAKALQDRITELAQLFERNVRDQVVQVALSETELKGMAPSLYASAKRDDQGRVLLTVDDSTYFPVMQNALDASVRERVWRADTNKGGEPNLKLLAELARLRLDYAQLFGAASYADFKLRRNMAQTAARAGRFLTDVQQAVSERERLEFDEMRAAKAQALGKPVSDVRLERWDSAYYAEQIRRARHAVDQEAFRPHFPPQESLLMSMRMIEKMMGVRYTRVPGVSLWHADVQTWAVSDAASGKPLATLFVDLYPREGKSGGAFVSGFRNGSTRLNRVPQAVLVTNLDRRGLTLDDFGETLLHEFGHAVHNNLSSTRLVTQGGTNVLRDFVEAPSQMLQDWVYDRSVLDLMREVCAACPTMPDELLIKARAAKRFGIGTRYARQALYASFDLALNGPGAPEPMALWARMEGKTPLGHVAGSMFPAGFTHLASGYTAGYYGYLWSEVVAADLRTAFSARLDPVVGRRYRETVLANAGQRPPQSLVRDFLGRETNTTAFFEDLKR